MRLRLVSVASVAFLLALCCQPAGARWKQEYAKASPEEIAWYRRQQTTPETRKRIRADWYLYCCDHSDTVRAKFSKTDGRWMYREEDSSEWKTIPQDIVQPDIDTPRGEPVLFVDATYHNFGPTCFFPGGTGT